jgi:DNA invertase Pin-like site-specific DNA recombinase
MTLKSTQSHNRRTQLNPTRKILGYTRVSTLDQAKDDRSSLAAQEAAIRGLAMIHGIEDIEIFADPGISGAVALEDRPGGAKLCARLAPGTIVVASKLDRIFRSASDALTTVERWKAQGIDLILIDCGTDPVSANGTSKLFFSILASVAEFEKMRILERTKEGRAGKKARGGHIGGSAPYGFRKVGEGRAAMLEHDPAEQAVIQRIKDLRDQGATYRKVIDQLTDEGHFMRSGTPFTLPQLHSILHSDRA